VCSSHSFLDGIWMMLPKNTRKIYTGSNRLEAKDPTSCG
jgi:hypothetical protein